MISYHLGRDANKVARGWLNPFVSDSSYWPKSLSERLPDSLETVASLASRYVWSAAIFKDGYRLNNNVLENHYIGLDFDEGRTLAWAMKVFENYACIIGTTKSHQKEKTQPSGNVLAACDRFRVILRLSEPIDDPYVFKATAQDMQRLFKTDGACVDPARFFFPCADIVFIGREDGAKLRPRPVPPKKEFKPGPLTPAKGTGRACDELRAGKGFEGGHRHVSIIRVAYSMAYQQAGDQEIYNFIRPRTDKADSEIWAAIASAKRKVQG